MTRNLSRILLLSFLITIVFVSCKKGDTGETGATGAAGSTGPTGPQGPKGDTGTANVIYSDWLDVIYQPATDPATGDTIAWTASIPATKLSDSILNLGAVKVYLNAGTRAAPAVFPLPITDLFALTGVLNVNCYFTLQVINIYATDDASTFTSQGEKTFQYRYVLIPGGVHGVLKQTDWNDYNQVKSTLEIKD